MTQQKIAQAVPEYDLRSDRTPPPAGTLAFLSRPEVLIARAKVRLEIARQDIAAGDTLAEWRNKSIATQMFRRAGEKL